jgi:hypothetical protein
VFGIASLGGQARLLCYHQSKEISEIVIIAAGRLCFVLAFAIIDNNRSLYIFSENKKSMKFCSVYRTATNIVHVVTVLFFGGRGCKM